MAVTHNVFHIVCMSLPNISMLKNKNGHGDILPSGVSSYATMGQ